MDLVLSQLYHERRRAKLHQPSFMLGISNGLPVGGKRGRKWEDKVVPQDSVASMQSVTATSIPRAQRLPNIQRGGRDADGAQTSREMESGAGVGTTASDGFSTKSPKSNKVANSAIWSDGHSRSDGHHRTMDQLHPSERPSHGRLPSVNPPGELTMEFQGAGVPPDRQYYTLKVRVEDITYCKEDGEDDPGLQVALSVDGTTCMTKVTKRPYNSPDDKVHLGKESFIFQPEGSPIGTLLMIKLLGIRPRLEPQELGTALIDLSTVPVGGHPITLVSPLSNETGRVMQVTVAVKMYYRRKSFTFSYLSVEPVFRRSGYAVTADGLQGFPMPYKKKGMPPGVSFFTLKYVHRIEEDVAGHEIWKAVDKTGHAYTVKKFLIMETACRVLFCSELDGIIECEQGQAVELCDAFLDGVRLSIVIDDMGGICLRDSLKERGPAPEMVTSIVLRQVLQTINYLHSVRSRLHNDIDARNIMILKTGEVRLGGFSYSIKHVGKKGKFAGPYVHMAPERLLGLECSFPADVWSVGMLALELALGRCWHKMDKFTGLHALFEFKRMVVTEPSPSLKGIPGCSDELRNFVDMCLHKNVRNRHTPAELLEHPLIQRFETFMLPAGTWLSKRHKEEHTKGHRKMSIVSQLEATILGGTGVKTRGTDRN